MIRCLGFHTEALHDDRVWRRLQVVAKDHGNTWKPCHVLRVSVSSIRGRKDILDRVKRLAAMGHEIGQHTHFYSGRAVEKPHKTNDLGEDNVRGCIQRDHEYLCRAATPEGFTAGDGWCRMRSMPH
jgi:hypothetical protein